MIVPPKADKLKASDYERHATKPSRYVPGAEVHSTISWCPLCRAIVERHHGEAVVCDCGLHMVQAGNALYVWTEED